MISLWLFVVLQVPALALVAVLATWLLRYRRRLVLAVAEHHATAVRFDASAWHPDRRTGLEKRLGELRDRNNRLEHNYSVLLARHKTLIREFQRVQQARAALSPQPSSPVPVAARA